MWAVLTTHDTRGVTKFEIRNPKQARTNEIQMTET
jgi:hypothetical protein